MEREPWFEAPSSVFEELTTKPMPEEITWADVLVGDRISLIIFDHQLGLEREYRYVLAVDWPTITLHDPGTDRVYEFDAEEPDRINRRLRRHAHNAPANSQARPE